MKIEYVVIFIIIIFTSIIISYRFQNKPQYNIIKNKLPAFEKIGSLAKYSGDDFKDDIITYNPDGIKITIDNNVVTISYPVKKYSFSITGIGKKKAFITSVAASDDFIFIADAGNSEVFVFLYNGKLQKKIGKANGRQFVIPSPYFDIVWDNADKRLFVANPGIHCVEIFNEKGVFIKKWGKSGWYEGEFAGCCNPSDMAIYKKYLAVSEKGLKRVRLFSKSGKYISTIADAGNFPALNTTIDLLTTYDGKFLLKDRKNKTIYYFTEN